MWRKMCGVFRKKTEIREENKSEAHDDRCKSRKSERQALPSCNAPIKYVLFTVALIASAETE